MTPTLGKDKQEIDAIRRSVQITADANNVVPRRIEILRAGHWPEACNKGAIDIELSDLSEYKANFDAGIGIPRTLGKLPVDYKHESWDKAAGWYTAMEVVGDTLFADVDWTPAGRQALIDGEFKCFSPSFWPGCLGEWQDPENWEIKARNVIVGGALTNIPFFKGLTSIMASNSDNPDAKKENVIYLSAHAKEKPRMTLQEILAKENGQVTADERKFLDDHKAELNADDRAKFYPEDKPADKPVESSQLDAADLAILADIKNGTKKLVEASAYDALNGKVEAMNSQIEAMAKQAEETKHKEASAFVEKHFERGAIKADQKDQWVKLVLADEGNKALLESVQGEPLLGKQLSANNIPEGSARSKVEAAVKELQKENTQLSYGDAVSKVFADNRALETEYQQELRG